jgi:hypothetical protein
MKLQKNKIKIRGLQIAIQVVTLKIISCRTMWKKKTEKKEKKRKKKERLKSYILWIKLITYERTALGHLITLIQNLATILERMQRNQQKLYI